MQEIYFVFEVLNLLVHVFNSVADFDTGKCEFKSPGNLTGSASVASKSNIRLSHGTDVN
jgi:hypothetical protein